MICSVCEDSGRELVEDDTHPNGGFWRDCTNEIHEPSAESISDGLDVARLTGRATPALVAEIVRLVSICIVCGAERRRDCVCHRRLMGGGAA